MIQAYPKIFAIGHTWVQEIFFDEVEVTEKVDGSQFTFGKDKEGKLHIRSKGALIDVYNPPKMFKEGVDYVQSIEGIVPKNSAFYCEYLQKPKHNMLKYDSIPTNHLVLFGASDFDRTKMYTDMEREAFSALFNIDSVPIFFKGKVASEEELFKLLDQDSYLGGSKIEGIVVKNYKRTYELNGQILPLMTAKHVSEAFKEVHRNEWKGQHTARGQWEEYVKGFKTEARWEKAIQRMKEADTLQNAPQDIGPLLESINLDIIEEEKDAIMEFLWKKFSKDVFRVATGGFPNWYKDKLIKGVQFSEETNI